MQNRLLPASIFALAFAVFASRLVPTATAQEAQLPVVCEEDFRTPAGIKRDKVLEWMTAQRAAGRTQFLPFGIQGSVGMICAW